MRKLSFFLFFIFITYANCKTFRLGHSKGGNVGAPGDYKGEPLPKAQWFEQKLDHFSRSDERTWKQRYYMNDTFYTANASQPVFLMIGGEGPADPRWMVKGAWIEYAENFGALCFMVEHRFYGKSWPTSDISTKNLAYLSSNQALADLAYFITIMNHDYVPEGTKWIVFGGSYPGSLAAWMRLKYPHLVLGAVSSSGPLLAEVDFEKYFGVVVHALREKTGNDDCVYEIMKAHDEIETLISKTPRVLEKDFRLCSPISEATPSDINNLFVSIADEFAELVQYNEDNRISAKKKFKNVTINNVCKMLSKNSSEPAYKKLAKFNAVTLDDQPCLDYNYTEMINSLRNPSRTNDSARQWMYQTCTEFGFFQTSSAEKRVFGNGFPVEFFIKQCEDVFGMKYNKWFLNEAVSWTNTYYGGLNITASNVLYIHGSVDPWHALGITEDDHLNEGTGVIFIKGTAHCADMYPSRASDLPALRVAREEVAGYLRSWLNG